jgi:hypothetical protein
VLPSIADVNVDEQREHLRRLVTYVETACALWHASIDQSERDYFLADTGDRTPGRDDRDRVRLSDMGNIAEAFKNIFVRSGYRIYVDRPGEMQPDKKKSGAVEGFFRNVVKSVERRLDDDLDLQIVDYQARLHAAVVQVAFNPSPDDSDDLGPPLNIPPIDVWVHDPRTFFPMVGGPNGSQFAYVVHKKKLSLFSALQLANATLADSPLALEELKDKYGHVKPEDLYTEEQTLYDYWGYHYIDGERYVVNAVMYGEALLRPFTIMPGYRALPWILIPAKDTRSPSLVKRWPSFAYHARPSVRHSERLLGMADTIMEKSAGLKAVITTTPESSEPPEIRSGRDQIIVLKPGQTMQPPPFVGLGRDLWELIGMAQDRTERSGFSRGVYGQSGPASGMNSGYGYEQQQEGGILKMGEPAARLQKGYEKLFYLIAQLVSTHVPDQPVYVQYAQNYGEDKVVLMGADLAGWTIRVKWRTELPNEMVRKFTMAQMAVSSGLVDKEYAREHILDIEDPVAMEERIMRETIKMAHPQIGEAYAFQILYEMEALPNFTVSERAKLGAEMEQLVGHMRAMGAPEQIVQQTALMMIEKKKGELMMQFMQPPMLPGGPGGPPPSPDQGNHNPKPNDQLGRTMRDPAMGVMPSGRPQNGQAPEGGGADPANGLRNQINQMRPPGPGG